MLRRIAVVNVKKVNGVSISESDDLEQYVQNNTDLLRREITHVKPKIIICGGTFNFLDHLAADGTCLAGGQVTVVAVGQVDADLEAACILKRSIASRARGTLI